MGKAGRKRRAGKREPNGRLSRRTTDKQARRTIDEQAAMQVAKEARQRVYGVSADDSATDLAGTVCGRLALAHVISPAQFEAAKVFAATYAAYQRALGSPRPPKAVEIGGATGGGVASDMTEGQYASAIFMWERVKRVLVIANCMEQHRGRTIFAACDYFILRDEETPNVLHMLDDLRVGLDYLVWFYGLGALAA